MNYKHLRYFHTVLRAGGLVRASEQLHLTPQTLSGQIKQLEARIGQPLLRKSGRGLEPTDAGRLVARYAAEIFALGDALQDALSTGHDTRRQSVLRAGTAGHDRGPALEFHRCPLLRRRLGRSEAGDPAAVDQDRLPVDPVAGS